MSLLNRSNQLLSIAIFVLVASCSISSFASAHTTGVSIEQEVGGYLVDIGYAPEVILEGTQTRLDFDVFSLASGTPVAFDDIWLRIEDDSKILFAGGLAKPRFGVTGVSYVFPKPGTYTGFVRFSANQETVVETNFTLEVQGISQPWYQSYVSDRYLWLGASILFLFGVLSGFFFGRTSISDKVRTNKPQPSQNRKALSSVGSVLLILVAGGTAFLFTLWILQAL